MFDSSVLQHGTPTVSNIIRRLRNALTKPKHKGGPRRKLCERSIRLFQKFVLEYSIDPLYVIPVRFRETTGIALSQQTERNIYVTIMCTITYPFENHFYQRDIYRHVLHGHALMSN